MTILSVNISKQAVCAVNAIIQQLMCRMCSLFSTQKHEFENLFEM